MKSRKLYKICAIFLSLFIIIYIFRNNNPATRPGKMIEPDYDLTQPRPASSKAHRITSADGAACNNCDATCNNKWEDCLQACTNINGDSGCQDSCLLQNTACTNNCYPPCPLTYALRNASAYKMYFYNSEGTFLDSREWASPYRLVVKGSDFPITAAYCDDLSPKGCPTTNDYRLVVNEPGCYIFWYGRSIYTTNEVCYSS